MPPLPPKSTGIFLPSGKGTTASGPASPTKYVGSVAIPPDAYPFMPPFAIGITPPSAIGIPKALLSIFIVIIFASTCAKDVSIDFAIPLNASFIDIVPSITP